MRKRPMQLQSWRDRNCCCSQQLPPGSGWHLGTRAWQILPETTEACLAGTLVSYQARDQSLIQTKLTRTDL